MQSQKDGSIMKVRHFLTLLDLSPSEHQRLLSRAQQLKAMHYQGARYEPLRNKVLGMVFEKSSTRTRVSFEAGIVQLGGTAIFLSPRDTQLGRGEPTEDTARVLSRMLDCVVMRTYDQETLECFAAHSLVPVINALTDRYHPCQLLADMQTYYEHRGAIRGRTVAWIGDGNNMCHSYINASCSFDFRLQIACPPQFEPDRGIVGSAGDRVEITSDPHKAASDADLVVTDVWASMGQEKEGAKRQEAFRNFQVNDALLAQARPDALFMHCLPAHRGEEVSASVIDGPQSVVWDDAENRRHSQKALLEFLLAKGNERL
jgi:ornithine carbamoyltransferase